MKRRMLGKSPLILLAAAVILLGSCTKTVSNANNNNPAYVSFIDMAPGAPSFTVKLDNDSIGNSTTFPYAGYAQDTTKALQYKSLFAGIHSIAFVDDSLGYNLVSGQAQFANNIKYTVYLFDTLTSLGLQAVQIQDTYDSIPRGYAIMRFLNFCKNVQQIDLYSDTVKIIPTTWYAGSGNVSATSMSKYNMQLAPGNYLFKFYNTYAGAFMDSLVVPVTAGKAYSLFVTGLLDSTGAKAFTKGVINMN